MTDHRIQIRQQYGPKPERVQAELNATGSVIDITRIPYDARALLLRDIEQGDRLVTGEVAKAYLERLESITRRAEQEFWEMLRKAPSRGSGSDTFIYVGGTALPFN